MLFFIFYKILFSGLLRSIKREKMAQNDKILSIMLHISGTIHYMIVIYGRHVQNDDISRHFFFNFSKFWFSGLLVGWKGKKWPGMTKNSIRCAPYFRNHTSYDCHFWVCLWAKNAKMTQNDKILSVTLHISGSIHHMIVIFGTHE